MLGLQHVSLRHRRPSTTVATTSHRLEDTYRASQSEVSVATAITLTWSRTDSQTMSDTAGDEEELATPPDGHRPAKRARLGTPTDEEMQLNAPGPSYSAPAPAVTSTPLTPDVDIAAEEEYFNCHRAEATDEESYVNDLACVLVPTTAEEEEINDVPDTPTEDHDMSAASLTPIEVEEHIADEAHFVKLDAPADQGSPHPTPIVVDEPTIPAAPSFVPTCPMAKITHVNCTPPCATHSTQQLVEAQIHAAIGRRLARFNTYLSAQGTNEYTALVRKRVDNGVWTCVRLSRGLGKMLDQRHREAEQLAGQGNKQGLETLGAAIARAHRAHGFALATAMCRYLNGMSDALGRPERATEGFRRFDGRVATLMARFKKVTHDAHLPAMVRLDRATEKFKAAVGRSA